jgi:hypothetical protein
MQQVVVGVQMMQGLVEKLVVDIVLALGKLLEELALQATLLLLVVEQLTQDLAEGGLDFLRSVVTGSQAQAQTAW